MIRPIGLALVLICSSLGAPVSRAEPISRDEVPEPLRPWIGWALHGHEEARCPFFQGMRDRRQCAWPSRLSLDLGERGGQFTQRWRLHREEWVALPGSEEFWPQQVRVDGRSATVVPRGGVPSVRLAEGAHQIAGTFAWDALPSLLQVPTGTGLLRLTVEGRSVPFPLRDEAGRLWLRKQAEQAGGESSLEAVVHRRVLDEIPLLLQTRIELQVAGKSREVVLGKALPDRFVPMSLGGPLPSRVEKDGRLRVQVRPGRWTVMLTARHEGPVASITSPPNEEPWDEEEVWVFDARPHLRLVDVEGVPGIDPQQTTLPDDWKRFPAYLVRGGETMTLVEKRRGDSDPAPDRLALDRSWWLDFDGGGFTIRDQITGRLERSWRLEMAPPATLGRAAVNGQDQFVTVSETTGYAGVELREASLQLEADSRLQGDVASSPAVGWDHDFHQVAGRIHLPPGWRLFHASGVDDVSRTWIASWTLLDLFLVLIATMAIARLWGWRFGILAIATLGLIWIEPGAPRWIWLIVLAGEALRRALPGGRARRVVEIGHRLVIVLFIVILIPFMVRQVRGAIYPALEPRIAPSMMGVAGLAGRAAAPEAPVEEELDELSDVIEEKVIETEAFEEPAESGVVGRALSDSMLKSVSSAKPLPKRNRLTFVGNIAMPDPSAVVQTGPGLPEWSWREVRLNWRGPVERSQRLRLMLLSPRVNFALAFLRVALLSLLTIVILPIPPGSRPATMMRRIGIGRAGVAVLLALLGAAIAGGEARADIPSQELLNELRDRLLDEPDCFPGCASSPRMALEATRSSLTIRLDLHAAAATAVPLPGGAEQWIPRQVLLDGVSAAGLIRAPDGTLWIDLRAGRHQVLMEGGLPDREVVTLPLPLRPHRVTVRARDWSVEGLRENGRVADSLQLVRIRPRDGGAAGAVEPGPLPPFVRVERQLNLGLQWHVQTRVVRMTPTGTAIVLEVPLLEGESVNTEGIKVSDGHASINLGPNLPSVAWISSLDQGPAIDLRAPEDVAWTEVWRLAAGQVWHIEPEGIPVVHSPEGGGMRLREWRPWPGEAVSLRITRPEGLPGQTMTIDGTELTLNPGLRATDATLTIALRSSRGGQHVVTLPENAELQSVAIDGADQPIRQEGSKVTLPIRPGAQSVTMTWRHRPGIASLFRGPEVGIDAPSVNATIDIEMPRDRWILFTGGPRLGPAVLFWSFLFVALLASIGLGQVRLTPLRWYHWFILSLGLTQVTIWVALPIVAWLLALGWRRERGAAAGPLRFNIAQLALGGMTLIALVGLFTAIQKGLLGLPEMQISGNGSYGGSLRWYQDRSGVLLPRPWAFSLPLMVYRLAMLAWALWLAQALLRWLRWGWGCFTAGGHWRPLPKKKKEQPAPADPG